jgi:hypothetical protein
MHWKLVFIGVALFNTALIGQTIAPTMITGLAKGYKQSLVTTNVSQCVGSFAVPICHIVSGPPLIHRAAQGGNRYDQKGNVYTFEQPQPLLQVASELYIVSPEATSRKIGEITPRIACIQHSPTSLTITRRSSDAYSFNLSERALFIATSVDVRTIDFVVPAGFPMPVCDLSDFKGCKLW